MRVVRRMTPTLVALAVGVTACQRTDQLTNVPSGPTPPVANDSAGPTFQWAATASRLEGPDTLRVTITDPSGVRQARFHVLHGTTREVLSSTPFIVASGTSVTLTTSPGTLGVPLDTDVVVVAEAYDQRQRVGFSAAGTTAGSVDSLSVAGGPAFRAFAGQTLRSSTPLGGLHVLEELGLALVTVPSANRVDGIDLFTRRWTAWQIPVGSQPRAMVSHPSAWGAGTTVLVANAGGSDISILDVRSNGGGERERQRIPVGVVFSGNDTTRLPVAFDRLQTFCPEPACAVPVVLGTTAGTTAGSSYARYVIPTATSAASNTRLLAARATIMAGDSLLTATYRITLPTSGTNTVVTTATDVSRCAMYALGIGQTAVPTQLANAIFVATPSSYPAACASQLGRLQRYDRTSDGVVLSPLGRSNAIQDVRLRDFTVRQLVASPSGQQLLAAGPTSILLLTADLSLRGTIPTTGSIAMGFLPGRPGSPEDILIAAGTTLTLYDGTTLTPRWTRPLRVALSGTIAALPLTGDGAQLLVSLIDGQLGVWSLPLMSSPAGAVPAALLAESTP
jgi:hypothetical protein